VFTCYRFRTVQWSSYINEHHLQSVDIVKIWQAYSGWKMLIMIAFFLHLHVLIKMSVIVFLLLSTPSTC